MTIASRSDYRASLRERPQFLKTSAQGATSGIWWWTLWNGTGNPGAGTLAVGNTANGVVPTDATTGAPLLSVPSGAGYLTEVDGNCSAAAAGAVGLVCLYDRLFHSGAHAFNANDALTSQPSFASRVPNADYTCAELWVETVTTFTGVAAITATYTNSAGTPGRSTGSYSLVSATGAGSMYRLPLQAGDVGVQKIESILCATASAGTFNALVLRRLWVGRFDVLESNVGTRTKPVRHWLDMLGMPIVYGDSCLAAMYQGQTSLPTVDLALEVASK